MSGEQAVKDRQAFRAAFPTFYNWQKRYGAKGGWETRIVAAVALLALLPVVLASAAAPVLPGPSTAAAWTRHPADYVALPTVIACLLGRLLINR